MKRLLSLAALLCAGQNFSDAAVTSLVSRALVSHCQQAVDLGTWSGKAIPERGLVVGVYTTALPARASQQAFLATLKDLVQMLVDTDLWVDTSEAAGTRLDQWFAQASCPSDPPVLTTAGLLDQCALPADWFTVTPFTGLVTNAAGWCGMTNAFGHIVWTYGLCNYYVDHYADSLTNCVAFDGASYSSIAEMCADVTPIYSESFFADGFFSFMTSEGHLQMFEQSTNGGYARRMNIADFSIEEQLEKGVPLIVVPTSEFEPDADFYYAPGAVTVFGNANCGDFGSSKWDYCFTYWDSATTVSSYEGADCMSSSLAITNYFKNQAVCCDFFANAGNYASCLGDPYLTCVDPEYSDNPYVTEHCCDVLNPGNFDGYGCSKAGQSISVAAYPDTWGILRWNVPGGFEFR